MSSTQRKTPLWLPYVSEINVKKSSVTFVYKGGIYESQWKRIHSIMLYGAVCPLSEEFIDMCRRFKIPVCVHRRNIAQATWILPSVGFSREDILKKQILFRENKKKGLHITRTLLLAKFKSMSYLVKEPLGFKKLNSIKDMRILESMHAKQYWHRYFVRLKHPEFSRRGSPNHIKSTLDAVYKFIIGILLRWIVYHHFSPAHGFLHLPSDYPALAYDLVESYRGYIDRWVLDALLIVERDKIENSNGFVINYIKERLNEQVYTHPTRQIVTFHELLHGSVLALRAYLLGNSQRFIVPVPAKPKGGRPVKAGYLLYGRSAGPTDFWEKAKTLSKTK